MRRRWLTAGLALGAMASGWSCSCAPAQSENDGGGEEPVEDAGTTDAGTSEDAGLEPDGGTLPDGGVLWTDALYLKASNPSQADEFGASVSVSGETLVVGAPHESSNASGVNGNQADDSLASSGAVYVFARDGGVWVQQAYLKASNPGEADVFGSSVSLSGDTLAVGARGEASSARGVNGDQADNSLDGAGAVYVFVRSAGVWAQQAYLKASNSGAYDFFGRSVFLVGDTLAVGAYGEASGDGGTNADPLDDSAPNAGAVYVFVRSGGVWTEQAYLKASLAGAGDFFGASVSLSGESLAVGAYGEASSATGVNGNAADDLAAGAGAAYVFVRTGGTWTQQAYLKASNTGAGDAFGTSVSLSADLLAVGAPGEAGAATGVNGNPSSDGAPASGAVYVFARSGTSWVQEAYVKASNAEAGDAFGESVSLNGNSLAAGAYQESGSGRSFLGDPADNGALASGAVYVFRRWPAAWSQSGYLKAPNTEAGDEFGCAVSLGESSLAVGAIRESSKSAGVNGDGQDNSLPGAGAVTLFE